MFSILKLGKNNESLIDNWYLLLQVELYFVNSGKKGRDSDFNCYCLKFN